MLRSGKSLKKLGGMPEQMAEVVAEATKFIAACYGYPSEDNMTSLRYAVWSMMAELKLNSAPDFKVLPPTSEVFGEHVYKSHLQAAIWRFALDAYPPTSILFIIVGL